VDFFAQLRCGITDNPAGYREIGFVTPQYAVVYLVAGTGTYEDADGRSYPLVPGSLYQRFPGQRHSIRMREPSRKCFVGVPRQVYEMMRITGFGALERPVVQIGLSQALVERFRELLTELRSRPPTQFVFSLLHMQQLIFDLHQEAGRQAGRGTPAAEPDWLERACTALSSDLDRDLRMPDVARDLHMSYSAFRKQFMARMHVTPGRYRIRCRIERAMEALLSTDRPLKEIASSLGYPNVYTFSRQFRQFAGEPPGSFRRANRRMVLDVEAGRERC
jgi:AraC-like DNA-binding protein